MMLLIFSDFFLLLLLWYTWPFIIFLNDDDLEFSYKNPIYGLVQAIYVTIHNHCAMLPNSRMSNKDYVCSISEFIVISTISMFLHVTIMIGIWGMWLLEIFQFSWAHCNHGSFLF